MFGNDSSTRWRLGTLRGHQLYMEPFFLLLVAFFVFMNLKSAGQLVDNLVWAPILFVGILWHELGHAAAMKFYGYGPSTIVLQGFGGVTINHRRHYTPPGASIVISIMGPLASLSLGLGSLGAWWAMGAGSETLLSRFLLLNGQVNLFWTVFNMLPINPMDGGHVVLHSLRKFTTEGKAMLYSAWSSLGVIGALGLGLLATGHLRSMGMMFIVIMIMFGMQNVQTIQAFGGSRRS